MDGTMESLNEDEEQSMQVEKTVPAMLKSKLRRQLLQASVKSMPNVLQDRITVLKNLQLIHLKIEAEFFEKVYQLEKEYQQKFQLLFAKRKTIVCGEWEPPKEKPLWKYKSDEPYDDILNAGIFLKKTKTIPEDVKGIPHFWLKIFHNTPLLSEMVQEHDEPVLEKLTDISLKYDDGPSFILEFHFDKNEYFSNEILTKQYFLKTTLNEDYPFEFEGPEIYKCKGCNINWQKDMDLTVKTIHKKQKHKERETVRTVVKHMPNDSFFNFFNPPEILGDIDEIDENTQNILSTDYEIGHALRSRIIPKAILYYTGDKVDDEDDSYYGESDEDDEKSAVDFSNKKKNSSNTCEQQ